MNDKISEQKRSFGYCPDNALKFIRTYDMTFDEIEEWEKENDAVSVGFDNGGVIEFFPTELFSVRDGIKVPGSGTKAVMISMCDSMCEHEVSELVSSKDEIRKLRDMLNRYLES